MHDPPVRHLSGSPEAQPRHGAHFPFTRNDLRGLAQLGVDAVLGVTRVVEAMHHTIASRPRPIGPGPIGQTAGITGLVYRAIRGTTRSVGRGLDALLLTLPRNARSSAPSPDREAFVAAVNGVWGDHLARTTNPLAIRMSLRVDAGRGAPDPRPPTGRLLVLVHGLAMNDLQWTRRGHDHGQALARDGGFTAIYLHYNSGLHVSHNGRAFAGLLEELVATWPVPVEDLVIVGHSMGGLVARSACHLGAGQRWRRHLTRLVCLGTPHHGAPLERGGRLVDAALGISPYAAPLARLGQTRSAGITDLRFGNVVDADGPRGTRARDSRVALPLPADVQTYLVAATTAASADGWRSATVGDGLVPLTSALGRHRDPALALGVPARRCFVATGAHHWDLLDRADVYARLRTWLVRREPAVPSSRR
ncbi:MAG TPA: alpha/beta hydrolase [Burkholderiaceae bacterium]|nr:alpha/beta hydrolase [Burkholderiaceae bacterium]